MDLNRKMRKYFISKQDKTLKLSNGYSVKLTVVSTDYSSLMLRFCYNGETTDINFNCYGGLIIALSDYDSKQVKVIDMHHVGHIIDTTLCDWVESGDETGLEWE
jgi:hypothetical protein